MTDVLRTTCVCGWESTGAEDEVVAATLDHGLRVHNMAGTREQVLERAERVSSPPTDGTGADASALSILDVPERRRFEARLGSEIVGFTQYDTRSGEFAILHTEIDPVYEGKGFGSQLAAGVLDAARGSGLKVVVRCPFISAYVRRHPEDYPDIDLDAGRASSSATG